MKKKVCIIHKVSTLDPRSFYKEGRSLSKAGYDTCIMSFYDKTETIQGVNLISFKPPRRRLTRFLLTNYFIFLKALKEKADVYHFHDLDFIPWAVLLKIVTNAIIIYDIHEAHPEYMLLKTYIPKIFRRIFSVLIYVMEHISIIIFDAIIPNDNNIAKGFRHKNNVVIYNFPTLDFFINNVILWKDRKYDLFYHGSLPKYHFEFMMLVAERLNSHNIKNTWGVVISSMSPQAWIYQKIAKRKLENNFILLPYTDYLNVSKYLIDAKIGIIPLPPFKKFMKNIPLKMFEFMGMGMPMVLSDLPPSRQFIKGENCAIPVEPNNVNEYVEAIKLLLSNHDKSIEMGKNGMKLILEKYNWSTEEQKLLNLYQRIIR